MREFAFKVLTAKQGETHLFFVGQAGFILKSKRGQLLGVDLYLSDCVERVEGHPGFRRLVPKLLFPYEIEFDYLITTHPHLDHFDMDSIPQMMSNHRTELYASTNCEQLVEHLHMSNEKIKYVKPGDSCLSGDFRIDFINCDHGEGAPDAFGILVMVDDKTICMIGDTRLHLDRTEEYLQRGKPDILIAPINGMNGNLNGEECALLVDALKPALLIPCHFGMFASHGGDPCAFYDLMTDRYPQNKYLIMCPGERLTL